MWFHALLVKTMIIGVVPQAAWVSDKLEVDHLDGRRHQARSTRLQPRHGAEWLQNYYILQNREVNVVLLIICHSCLRFRTCCFSSVKCFATGSNIDLILLTPDKSIHNIEYG
jgi:hypothetical protein